MKGNRRVYHKPYYPLRLKEREKLPYIARIAPNKDYFEIEWLDNFCDFGHVLFYGVRGEDKKLSVALSGNVVKIDGLLTNTDYEFYIENGKGEKSLVRYVRTGEIPKNTTVINYLHPDDTYYDYSGRYLCTPALARIKNRLVAGMDVYGPNTAQNLVLLFKSDDDGKTWRYLNDLSPFYWATLFVHKDKLYAFGATTEYGDLQIISSCDLGETWSEPTVLFYGAGGKAGYGGNHRAPMHFTEFNGRLYTSCEWAGYKENLPMVVSVGIDDDLMDEKNWIRSEPVLFDGKWKEDSLGKEGDCIEGNLTIVDGELYNIVRWKMGEFVRFRVNTLDLDAPLEYIGIEKAPVSNSMFRFVPYNDGHLLITNRKGDNAKESNCWSYRNVLSVYFTKDTKNFVWLNDLFNYQDVEPEKIGFQYPAHLLEGDKIRLVIRSAFNNPSSFHNTNYSLYCEINAKDGKYI